VRPGAEPAFVDQNDLAAFFLGFFLSPAHWTLATPAQLPQQFPNMRRMVRNPKLFFHQMRHPGAGPQRSFVAQRLRSGSQALFQSLALIGSQLRLASRTTRLPQRLSTLLTSLSRPSAHGLLRHFQSTANFSLTQSLLQQIQSLKPPLLQGHKIPLCISSLRHIGTTL
jgi:hypothetical protein